MKSIFLVALVFLALDWPKSSVCWPMQQYSDFSQANPLFGQQIPTNQFNHGFRNNFKMNPELMMAKSKGEGDQRAAFSRTTGNAKAKKLSNTRFLLKPNEIDSMVERDFSRLAEEAMQKLKNAKPKQFLSQKIESVSAPKAQVEQQTIKETETINKEVPAAAPISSELIKAVKQKASESAAESKLTDEPIQVLAAQAEHGSIKSASSEKQEEQAAAIQQQTEWIQQHQQQQQQQQHQNEWAEQQKQNDWNQEHQESQWSQIEQPSKVEEAKILTLKRPTTSNQEFFRQMNLPQQQQFQQQQQHLYNKQQQLQQQHEEEQQHLLDAPALEESSNINKETLKFKYAKPDLVHTVGMDTVKNEAMKVSRQREENKDTEVPLSHRGKGRGNGFNRELLGGFDTLGGRFNSLIIIANSNSNANLGVATLDPDLCRSFLSQFAGKSVDEVLKDRELDEKFAKFNQEHRLTDEEKDEDPDKDQDKDKDRDNGGKKTKKRGKTEKTTELSANIPGYTGKPSNSHSDSTIVLKKESRASEGESTKNLGYVDPSNFYNYYNYQDGGVIVINNVNDNHNHRIRSILSGEGINLGDQSAGLVLPLSKGEIDRLMEDAIIINNENRNKNRHH